MKNTLLYKGYEGSVEFSAEDMLFIGKILHINDLVSFDGETPIEIKTAFEEAVDDYLEFCQEEGIDPDKPYKGSFNVRVTAELHKRAAQYAGRKKQSLNEFVGDGLAHWISMNAHLDHSSSETKQVSVLVRVDNKAPTTQFEGYTEVNPHLKKVV